MLRAAQLDWPNIEREYRAGQLSIRQIAHQYGLTDSGIRKHAKAHGWTDDLSSAVRARVRESLVREAVRASSKCELMGVVPSDAAIVDEAAAVGVAVVRSHRRDIGELREAAAGLLTELGLRGPPQEWQLSGEEGPLLLKVGDRTRVIADLSRCMALLIPLERQAFGLDEDRPGGSQPMTVVWEGMPQPAYD